MNVRSLAAATPTCRPTACKFFRAWVGCQQLIMGGRLTSGDPCALTETTALCDMWESDVGLWGPRSAETEGTEKEGLHL